MYLPVILCLAQDGDSLYLQINGEGFRDVKSTDHVHPYLKKATECKTHQAVLWFLEGIRGNENFKPYHMHNPVHSHYQPAEFKTEDGIAHYCPVDNMIHFIRSRILENTTRERSLTKMAKY